MIIPNSKTDDKQGVLQRLWPFRKKRYFQVAFNEDGGRLQGTMMVCCHRIDHLDSHTFKADGVTITLDEYIQFIQLWEGER